MIHSSSPYIFIHGNWHWAGPECWCQPTFYRIEASRYCYVGHRPEYQGARDA